nr:glutathione S-transferase GSTs8 [Agrotis ipsilon]
MSKYKYYYFDAKALGESGRLLLAYGGQEFQDIRFTDEEWPAVKPKMEYGKVPMLEIDGKQYSQSKAISRYLGRKYGLAGDTLEDALEIDQIVDLLVDLRTKAEETNWRFETNEEVRERRFADYAKNVFPDYLERLNAAAVKNNGHFALGKLTWADFMLAGTFDYLKNLVRIPDLAKKYPAFQKVIDNVYSFPQVKAYADAAPHTDE